MLKRAGIEELYLSPRRPRKGTPPVSAALQRLVRQFGPVLPVIVRTGGPRRYEILSNAETWVAAQRAGYRELPILLRESVTDAEVDAILRMDTPENPIARATRYARRLAELPGGRSYGDIASLAREERCSRSHIAHHLRLLELHPQIQEAISIGLLNLGQAKALACCEPGDRQLHLATNAITGRWSVRQTEAAVRRAPGDSGHQRRLERALSDLVGSPVTLDSDRGHLVIDYRKDLDVLQGVLIKLGWNPKTH